MTSPKPNAEPTSAHNAGSSPAPHRSPAPVIDDDTAVPKPVVEQEEGEADETHEYQKASSNSDARLHATTYKPPPNDGWEARWDATNQAWYFYNTFTGKSQWENPRIPETATDDGPPGTAPLPSESSSLPSPAPQKPRAGGYNPAIHGDYDPNADYAKVYEEEEPDNFIQPPLPQDSTSSDYAQSGAFNRFTGRFQADGIDASNHNDAAKSKRQLNAFFDVDAAANSHDGRSLKAERQNQSLSKSQVKDFKNKRRAKKEEKRRAWLRD